jgi:hypothetical protein
MAKKSNPVYVRVLKALTVLCATRLFSGQWIQGSVIVKLLQDASFVVPNLDISSFNEQKLNYTFGRTALSFVDAIYTPNEVGIYRRTKYVNTKNVYFYYFTLCKNSIPSSNTQ